MKTFPIFSEKEIQAKVKELAEEINKKYGKKELLVIGLLKGAFVFYSDLIKQLTTTTICDFCSLSFYGDSTKAQFETYLSLDVALSIKDKDVLLVDCIADGGSSLKYMQDHILKRQPKTLSSVVLLCKPAARKKVKIDFEGFSVDQDSFIVGYGIDYKEQGRNLPYFAQVEDLN